MGNFFVDVWSWALWTRRPAACTFCKLQDKFDIDPPSVSWAAKVCAFILNTAVDMLMSSLVALILVDLILFHPNSVHPRVDDAAITTFELKNDTTGGGGSSLRYDLSMAVTFFNDHRIYAIRFDHLTAGLYFDGAKLGPSDTLPSFKLHTRRHRKLRPVFHGRESNISAAVAEEFARERAAGTGRSITVDVRLRTTLRYLSWPFKATYYRVYHCSIQFPPPTNNIAVPSPSINYHCAR
ncbi:hypothetical protein E2562_022018 [Oryza meyeriana var. granulata]|uniref:Late embryogenesis abundant protein LEA-2 subgroup domain-containing protein n=1 Tax=Oryza meyeriana var. granulata TaxID=110450 RepID=A0A6G1ENI7_9ORYZ|nr:hypothetical protein E2562_022018 [Oryza meyeriana var. granulata]